MWPHAVAHALAGAFSQHPHNGKEVNAGEAHMECFNASICNSISRYAVMYRSGGRLKGANDGFAVVTLVV